MGRPATIVCARPGVELTDYEKHLIKMFEKFLSDPRKVSKRCAWCFHKLKNCGKCRICDCSGGPNAHAR